MDVMFRSGELEVTLLGNLVRRFFEGEGADFQYGEKIQPPPCIKSRNYVISYVRHFPFTTAQLSFLRKSLVNSN
jgi:hypothetical protein